MSTEKKGRQELIFKKQAEPWVKPFPEKVAKRVAKIPTTELEMWVENSLYEIGRCMSMFSKHRSQQFLDEALAGAEALHAVVDELHRRSTR